MNFCKTIWKQARVVKRSISHAPTMASLLAKAKAAKQARMQRAAEARQRHLDAHKRCAQGLRAKEAQQYEPMQMG